MEHLHSSWYALHFRSSWNSWCITSTTSFVRYSKSSDGTLSISGTLHIECNERPWWFLPFSGCRCWSHMTASKVAMCPVVDLVITFSLPKEYYTTSNVLYSFQCECALNTTVSIRHLSSLNHWTLLTCSVTSLSFFAYQRFQKCLEALHCFSLGQGLSAASNPA